jgi:hypothetical protein
MSEAEEILYALVGVVVLLGLMYLPLWYHYKVRLPRRDITKLNAALEHVEQHGVDIQPGEDLKPHAERWGLMNAAMFYPKAYKVDPQRLKKAIQQYDPWVGDIRKAHFGKGSPVLDFPNGF